MKRQYRLALMVLTTTIAVAPTGVFGQAGGGTLSGEPAGGAAMIFRKPENPPVHGASGPSAVGGGKASGRRERALVLLSTCRSRRLPKRMLLAALPRRVTPKQN